MNTRPLAPPLASRPARRSLFPAAATWEGPTFAEFVARVRSEFGSPPRPTSGPASDLLDPRRGPAALTGLTASERLSPAALRELCCRWGLPPEDFGVDGD